MSSHYDVLGIEPSASLEDVKKAYRLKALLYHPDANPDGGATELQQFQAISEAYEVLRDETKRAAYDAARQAASTGFRAHRQSGASVFDETLEKWLRQQGFRQAETDEFHRAQSEAFRKFREAAWQAEKADAALNKARAQRQRQRTQAARAERQARTMARYWQTHTGITWQDLALATLFLAGSWGVLSLWRPPPEPPPDQRQA